MYKILRFSELKEEFSKIFETEYGPQLNDVTISHWIMESRYKFIDNLDKVLRPKKMDYVKGKSFIISEKSIGLDLEIGIHLAEREYKFLVPDLVIDCLGRKFKVTLLEQVISFRASSTKIMLTVM